jgi:hypothetical protein
MHGRDESALFRRNSAMKPDVQICIYVCHAEFALEKVKDHEAWRVKLEG